ncbi:histidine kinase dimerization/phosphoacceptor domain -containing protein [Pseudofulvibacter geojedonensis]|uniref:Histidine kinase dimerization/phosphoacceptor domain -containing protein n=1 Tax=Pseudofulvibacter geojedonensis TaxID=1123758 RepID=A0ABW3I3G0_9FLAO
MFGDFFLISFIVILIALLSVLFFKYKKVFVENCSLKKQLHHRVKNNMQLAYSLVNLQRRYVKNSNISRELDDTHKRLATLSLINKAYLCEDMVNNSISTKVYKDIFIDKIFNKYKAENGLLSPKCNKDPNFKVNFFFTNISIEEALPLGLIINELLLILFKKEINVKDHIAIDIDLLKKKLNVNLPNQGIIKRLNGDLQEGLSSKIIYRLSQQLNLTISLNTIEI